MDPISFTGIIISAVSAANSILDLAVKICAIYKSKNISSLPKLNLDNHNQFNCKPLNDRLSSKIDQKTKDNLNTCENVAVETISHIYDSYTDISKKLKFSVDVTLVTADSNGNYIKMLGVSYMCIKYEESDQDKISKIMKIINGIRELKQKEFLCNVGIHKCYIITLDCTPSYNDESLEKEHAAVLALIGEVISKCLDVNFDGRVIKVGFGRTVPVNYLSKINMMIEANWTGKDNPTNIKVRNIKDLINNSRDDIESLIKSIALIDSEENNVNIILLGQSGSGKSHTGNMLYEYLRVPGTSNIMPFRESKNGACTSRMNCVSCGNKIKIWDSPGLLDEYERDGIFIAKIKDSLLEIGQVSIVILCEKNLERTDRNYTKMINSYANIIGEPMQHKLIVAVNRQLELSDDNQKDTIISELSLNNVRISRNNIYDLMESDNMSEIRKEKSAEMMKSFIYNVLQKCSEKPVKLGMIEEIHRGLVKIQSMNDNISKDALKVELVNRSAKALINEMMDGTTEEPIIETIQTHKIVLKRHCSHNHIKRWSLKSAKKGSLFSRILQNVYIDIKEINEDNNISHAIEVLKNRNLVFLKRNEDISCTTDNFEKRTTTYRYVLLDVNEGLEKSVIQYLNDILESRNEKCINVYD